MRRPLVAATLLALASCGPKEARDPSEILAEDPAFLPAQDPVLTGREEGPPPIDRAANRSECEAAMRHLEELGLDIAIAEATSPEERAELRAKKAEIMGSAAVRDHVARAAEDCVARETTLREVRCVRAVRSEQEIDGCVR